MNLFQTWKKTQEHLPNNPTVALDPSIAAHLSMQPPHIFSDQASKVNQEIILYRLYFISIFILIIYSWKAAPILGSILWFVFGLRFFSGHFRDGHGRGTGVAATELSGQNHWRNHWPEELPQFQHTKKVVIVHQNGCLVGALSEPRKNSEHFQIANYALPQWLSQCQSIAWRKALVISCGSSLAETIQRKKHDAFTMFRLYFDAFNRTHVWKFFKVPLPH